MHTCLLIYKHSRHYNTPPRLVVLIKEICNAIITRANDYINGLQVAGALTSGSEEVTEVCKKLETTIDICTKFKDAYFEYRAKADGQWKLTLNALFSRLDAYTERCHDIHHLTMTIMQFNKLEKIELGGTKGKILTETLKQISEEFKKAVDNFRQLPYDTMDINVKEFDEDFLAFRNKIKELERRLASVITQGFDDNDTISGKYKLLDCFEGILNRPIIQDELEKKHAVLLEMYKQDLKTVQAIFLEGKALIDKNDERSPIYMNYPPIAGSLTWCKGLKDRISEPFDKLATLGQGITDREEYKDVQKLYTNILKTIKDYE
jgi:dynein heavy chain